MMAFPQQPTKTPTAVEDMRVSLTWLGTDKADVSKGKIGGSFGVLFDDDSLVIPSFGDSVMRQHLNSTQLQRIADFMSDLRTQAENELLP